MGEAVFHDTAEYSVSIGITGYTMDYMIWFFVIKPLPFIDPDISGFGGWQKSKVADNLVIVHYNKAPILLHISRNDSFGRVAFSPLVHIPRLPHYLLCSIHDCQNISHIRRLGFSDNPTHVPYSLIK
jgi:hypothetical protein